MVLLLGNAFVLCSRIYARVVFWPYNNRFGSSIAMDGWSDSLLFNSAAAMSAIFFEDGGMSIYLLLLLLLSLFSISYLSFPHSLSISRQ